MFLNKNTISLSKFSSLVKNTAHHAGNEEHRVHVWLKEFEKGKFDNFNNFYHEILELIKNLENIKVYVEREEKKQLDSLRNFLIQFFNSNILTKLSRKKEVKKLFETMIIRVINDLKKEYINEKKVSHQKPPKHSFFKNFFSNESLDRQIISDASKEIRLSSDVHHLSEDLLHTSKAISLGSKIDDDHFYKELTKLTIEFAKEFDLLLDEQLNVELQENDLLNILTSLSKEHDGQKTRILELKNIIESRFKRDIAISRNLFREAESIHHQLNRIN